MNIQSFISAQNIQSENYVREPIHSPGFIQPHGLFLVLSEPDLEILHISNNTENLLGLPAQKYLGQYLSILLESGQIAAIEGCLQGNFENINPLKLSVSSHGKSCLFNGVIHRSPQNDLILELEPCSSEGSHGFSNFYSLTRNALTQMQQASNLSELSAAIVKEVRKMTGFDRVMVYRFDENSCGEVIAEDKSEEIEPYLGLRYPDFDIPPHAKYLYTLNPLRLIADVNYQPVIITSKPQSTSSSSSPTQNSPQSLIPNRQSPIANPLDLTYSVLRSVSPCHIQYLKNMGVGASMSISLVKDRKLWGLVACHHQTPRFVSYEIRTACEFLGKVMSLELASKEENENLEYKLQLKCSQTKFIDTVAQSQDFAEALLQDRVSLLQLVHAEGAVVCADGHLTLIGKTPSEAAIHDLISWLSNKFQNYLFVSDSLSKLYPKAIEFKDVASGLLALSIARIRNNYVLWFRPERLQYVNWAGNPQQVNTVAPDGSLTLCPRKSFELWQEQVNGTSLPWQSFEIDGAIELRSAIVGIVLRKADELAAINLELERSNNELDAFSYIASHDLKEPLRGIHNYSTFLLEDYAKVLDNEGVSKLETLVRLTKRMEDLINSLLHFSRLGRQELNVGLIDCDELVQNVSEIFRMSLGNSNINIRIPKPLPTIWGDRILLEEVLINLIGNGFKYNDNLEKWVEIGYLDSIDQQKSLGTFYVKDNGIGIREKHLETIFRIFKRLHAPGKYGGGTGAGLTIVKKIIERHDGKIWVESTSGQGSTFYFTLPQ
ncbi:ATP-binding protein [Scytonema sp. NUACC26]|uniref:ATP-binding protein n=1 Tax=Scytonema sp. NUACC26 TaxID=3140176 RepID=UPI0034DC06E0